MSLPKLIRFRVKKIKKHTKWFYSVVQGYMAMGATEDCPVYSCACNLYYSDGSINQTCHTADTPEDAIRVATEHGQFLIEFYRSLAE